MNSLKLLNIFIVTLLLGGCATTHQVGGPKGPEIVTSGRSSQEGTYAEVGVEFSSVGDFVALITPSRWESPVATGGALSWVNPKAWREDWNRTGRIFIGQAVMIGGTVAVAMDQDEDSTRRVSYNIPTPPDTTNKPNDPF